MIISVIQVSWVEHVLIKISYGTPEGLPNRMFILLDEWQQESLGRLLDLETYYW